MERRVVDEIDVNVRRLVVLAIWARTGIKVERDKELTTGRTSDFFVYSTESCVGHDGMQKRCLKGGCKS